MLVTNGETGSLQQMTTRAFPQEKRTFAESLKIRFARLVPILSFLSLACALCLCLTATHPAYAEITGNVEQATFAVGKTNATALTFTITEPADDNGGLGEVELADGSSYAAATLVVDEVSQTIDGITYTYAVTSVGNNAFEGNDSLVSVEFSADLTGGIGSSAFCGCTALESVTFPQRTAGIGSSAFCGCSALSSLTFPDGAEIYLDSNYLGCAISDSAFKDCTSLEYVSLPAITTAERFGDYYYSFYDYNPTSSLLIGGGYSSITKLYVSAYVSFWHSGYVPVARAGIDNSAFSGCSALRSVVFQPGNNIGAFSYFLAGDIFEDCDSLESLVFMSDQAYWVNPNGAMHNGNYANANESATLYYAVNYYATEDEATSDDVYASSRIARVEFARNTPTAAIATSDANELADYVLGDSASYAEDGYSDGAIPDPNEAAVAAFGSEALGKTWAWKLTDTQSRREGLAESCSAYLVEANDLSAGRIAADEISALYKLCDQNYSQGSGQGVEVAVEDTAFDVVRYYKADEGTSNSYLFTVDVDDQSAWFALASDQEESLLSQIEVLAADGSRLAYGEDYTVSFQRYSESAEKLVACDLDDANGPLLVTITPTSGSGYAGTLSEWVLIQGHSGSVMELYTDTAAETDWAAVYYQGNSVAQTYVSFAESPYAVGVDTGDLVGALVACGYAGLAETAINVYDDGDSSFGFVVSTGFSANGTITGTTTTFSNSSSSFSTSAQYAVAAYQAFEKMRSSLGASTKAYPWGNVAVVVNPNHLEDVAAAAAAYAYAQKAPVFYSDANGAVDEDTLACLDDFDKVVVVGDTSVFSTSAMNALANSLPGKSVTRVGGDARNACSLSLAVADQLLADGSANASTVAISDASDPFDAIASLNLSGSQGGITLVSAATAESKALCTYLRELRDDVDLVRLFGRDDSGMSSSSFGLYETLDTLWSNDYRTVSAEAGDTLVLSGARFSVEADGTTLSFAEDLWPHDAIPAGTYSFAGTSYVLAEEVDAYPTLFLDVTDPQDWWYEAVYYVRDLGLMKGYDDGTTIDGIDMTGCFGAEQPMLRAELVTVLWRYSCPDEYTAYDDATQAATVGTTTLPDGSPISGVEDGTYYTAAANWALEQGVITGWEVAEGVYDFDPYGQLDFEQMVTMMARLLGGDAATSYDAQTMLNSTSYLDASSVSSWAQSCMAWSLDTQLVSGYDLLDGTYEIAPAETVARKRAATVIWKAYLAELMG